MISCSATIPEFTIGMGDIGAGPYTVAKHGVNMAVLKYAMKYKTESVMFIAMNPGIVGTAKEHL